jgi:hypothetical protein
MSNKEWGNITWKLFHTLAIQLDEKKFEHVKDLVIEIIVDTCRNLPCPICQKDATDLIKKAYLNKITSKKYLIEFLRQFHNIVNIKLHKKNVTETEINNIYKNTNLYNTIQEFIRIYNISYHNLKLNKSDYKKKNFINNFITKINKIQNIHNSN